MAPSHQSRTLSAHELSFCFLAGIIICLAPEVSEARTKITVTYDEVTTEISPRQQTIRSSKYRIYTISKDNTINVTTDDTGSVDRSLGKEEEGHMYGGMRYKLMNRLLGNVLFVITAFDGYTSVRKIKLLGHNCVSTLVFKKSPGHEHYEFVRPSETSFYSDMHAENIRCSVAKTSD